MTKRIFLIHRWDGNPEADWYPWLKTELKAKDFNFSIPTMPNPEEPKIDEWVNKLKEIIPKPDEQTYFIGHSIGCQTILRYLESLLEEIKIGGVILVAPWLHLTGLETEEEKEIAKPWLETPIDFDKIKKHTDNFIAIFSNNDPFVPLSDKDIFKEKLGAKIIIGQEKGHFTEDDDIKELPNALNSILELVKK